MHKSLILPEQPPYMKSDIIEYHGRSYFHIKKYLPEDSGLYEIMVDINSPYRSLIEERMFIPLLYYDKEENSWTHGGKSINIKNIQMIGWRLFI